VDSQLPHRMEVLQQLSQQLPSKIKERAVVSIDLSDPDQPELGLPAKAGTTANPSSGKPASNRD